MVLRRHTETHGEYWFIRGFTDSRVCFLLDSRCVSTQTQTHTDKCDWPARASACWQSCSSATSPLWALYTQLSSPSPRAPRIVRWRPAERCPADPELRLCLRTNETKREREEEVIFTRHLVKGYRKETWPLASWFSFSVDWNDKIYKYFFYFIWSRSVLWHGLNRYFSNSGMAPPGGAWSGARGKYSEGWAWEASNEICGTLDKKCAAAVMREG